MIAQSGLYSPRPYTDELLYSLLARFAFHLGITSHKNALYLLFDKKGVIVSSDLQGQLKRLSWLIEERMQMTLKDAALSFTLLPYYLVGRTRHVRDCAIADMLGHANSSAHTRLGVCATSVFLPTTLRCCGRCIEEDVSKYGETYWRRSHQLPGALLCPAHGTLLINTEVPIRPLGRHDLVPANPTMAIREVECVDLREIDFEKAFEISKLSQKLLDPSYLPKIIGNRTELFAQLNDLGYGRRRGAIADLENDFVRFFGKDLLERIDPNAFGGHGIGWLRGVRHSRQRTIHPLRWVLLELFVQSTNNSLDSRPLDRGPWKCRNWLCDHYEKSVIETFEPFKSKGSEEFDRARFLCECGFLYSTPMAELGGRDSFHVVTLGPLFEQRAKELHNEGCSVGRIATMLKIDRKTAVRLIAIKDSDNAFSLRSLEQSQDRKDWLELVVNNPALSVTEIRRLSPALYARLYRKDKKWLKEHSPKTSRQEVSLRVSWKARDEEYSRKVYATAQAIYKEIPLRRVTRSRIAGLLGCRAMFDKHIDKLPFVQQILSNVCETQEGFRIRRLRTAHAKLRSSFTRSQLLRVANIRDAFIYGSVEAELERILGRATEVR